MTDASVLNLVQHDISGGKITRESIDEISSSGCSKLKVSGLHQDTFDYLIDSYGSRFTEIDFWKCPRVFDLSRLSTLERIESVSFYWNQGAKRLWDMSTNRRLKKLSFLDFTKLCGLDDLATSTTLQDVRFGNAVWPKMVVESLQPLCNAPALEKLHFQPKKIADNRVGPLTELEKLRELEFPPSMFTMEKVAWLAARLGSAVRSSVLCAVRTLDSPICGKDKRLDALVIGKRKPFLDSNLDQAKLRKYIRKFDELTTYYSQNPQTGEPD